MHSSSTCRLSAPMSLLGKLYDHMRCNILQSIASFIFKCIYLNITDMAGSNYTHVYSGTFLTATPQQQPSAI